MSARTLDVKALMAPPTVTARAALVRGAQLGDAAGLDQLLDAAEHAVHEEPLVAFDLAEVCEALATALGLAGVMARALYLRARLCTERGDLDGALQLIDRARRSWLVAGDALAAMRTKLGLMHVLDELGRHDEAGRVGTVLLEELERYDAPADQVELCGRMRATAWNNVGASRCLAGNHGAALDAYAASEAAYEGVGLVHDRAQPLANRGIALVALGRPREALRVLRAAAAIFASSGDRLWQAKCGGVMAQAHQQLGELVEALRVLGCARAELEALDAHAEIVRIRLATANAYLSAGLFGEARAEAVASSESAARLGLRHDHAIATFVLALAHLHAGEIEEADIELRHAVVSFESLHDRQYSARVLLATAELAAREGRLDEAASRLAVAAATLADGGWRIPEAWARLRAADFAPSDRAASILVEVGPLIGELQLPDLRYAHELRWARVHAARGNTDLAESRLRAAIREVDLLGASVPDATLAMSLRADKLDAHDGLVGLLVSRGQPNDVAEALRLSDDVKARTLLDMIAGTVGTRSAAVLAGGSAERVISDRRADLSAVYNAMAVATTQLQLHQLQRDAQRLEDELAVLRLQSRATRSRHADLAPQGDARVPLDAPDDVTTVSFHAAGDDLLAFVVCGRDVRAHRLDGARPSVRSASARLLAQWNRCRTGSSVARRWSNALLTTTRHDLGELYQLLWAPLLDDIVDHGNTDVVVVPHRELHQVPFHALHDGNEHVLERWTISIAPTVYGVPGLAGQRPTRQGSTLVLAVPDERAASIDTEARRIAAVMPNSSVFIGGDATAEALRASVPGPSIVHLACHGLYRPANPMFSALRLNDGWLTAGEILDLDLGGALVTLSSCESGRPGHDTAEAVGLTWAFLAAGASGALVSQWIVDDDTTADLMARVYGNLASGHTPANALRSAQCEVAEYAPHPYYWAPFVHVASPSMQSTGLLV